MSQFAGDPILVSTQSTLHNYRGRLVAGGSGRGTAVYAAAFLRERNIILEAALLSNASAFRLILVHELFHFVWPRLANGVRKSFSGMLLDERNRGARGELGESSGVRKELFRLNGNPRLWREYVCESFCDTAAWLYAGVIADRSFTLRPRWQERRKLWFEAAATSGPWKC